MNLLEEHVREMIGGAPEWAASSYECMGGDLSQGYDGVEVKGAVYAVTEKGPRKGKPNYRKAQPGSARTVFVLRKNHDQWVKQWEEKTGKCSNCVGDGKVCWSVSVEHGARYRPCHVCSGTGRRP